MTDVADAWARYVRLATEAGAELDSLVEAAPDRQTVVDLLTESNMEFTDGIIDYFEVVYRIAPGSRLYPEGGAALDLAGAVAERDKLTEFAVAEAAEYDDAVPDDLFPERFFPLTSGKPTTSIDRVDDRVYSWWWDEPEPRPAGDDVAAWIDSQSALIEVDIERARRYFQPHSTTEPQSLETYVMIPGQVWVTAHGAIERRIPRAIREGRRLVITYAPVGSIPGLEGLELVQARTLMKLVVELGAPPERVRLEPTPPENDVFQVLHVRTEIDD